MYMISFKKIGGLAKGKAYKRNDLESKMDLDVNS
jgi:hypothetical protein